MSNILSSEHTALPTLRAGQKPRKIVGWKVYGDIGPDPAVVVVEHHTSNYDLPFLFLVKTFMGYGRIHFLMKSEWFRYGLGWFFKWIGGVPVIRDGSERRDTLGYAINGFINGHIKWLAITPSGTRARKRPSQKRACWKRGFLHIARGAKVPLVLAAIDYSRHEITLLRHDITSKPDDEVMAFCAAFFGEFAAGKHPTGETPVRL
ncbi:MAG: hypothetical protein COT81_03215 [Candidatus Buchananbacteria bacterium CG10_big_fil_rev_8_21_14_0_10_42_9]|uniref:Phospholipid/glycerol acyltransferase domain-containing protein n=1 Tax=Candidatus Buchananbacteria bacterium CG10_big_fil_rev_8_21_14_0_10_42_9 TaxID=1974526 RepID=A0A2H0W309_9BACT|nr:MAG: hypothetical protein COT81_03215 [Candidatus Buchananbacteria bacterium CG10_big_fil_rev_8_21_14_0_10_42_9]